MKGKTGVKKMMIGGMSGGSGGGFRPSAGISALRAAQDAKRAPSAAVLANRAKNDERAMQSAQARASRAAARMPRNPRSMKVGGNTAGKKKY